MQEHPQQVRTAPTSGVIGIESLLRDSVYVLRRRGLVLLILCAVACLPNAIRLAIIEQIGAAQLQANPNLAHTPELLALSCMHIAAALGFMMVACTIIIPVFVGAKKWSATQYLRGIAVFFLQMTAIVAGCLFFVLPGIYLYFRWFVSLPVAMTEDVGIRDVFGRSSELMRGRMLAVAATLITFSLPIFILGAVATRDGQPLPALSLYLTAIVVNLFVGCLPAVVYARLRTFEDTAP